MSEETQQEAAPTANNNEELLNQIKTLESRVQSMDSKNKQRQLDEQSQANKQIAVTRDIKNQALQDKQDLFHKQNIEGEKFGELPNAKKFAGGRFGGGYVEFDDGTNYKETLDLSSEGKPESLIKDYKAFNKDFTSGSYSYLDDPDFEHTKTEQKKLKD